MLKIALKTLCGLSCIYPLTLTPTAPSLARSPNLRAFACAPSYVWNAFLLGSADSLSPLQPPGSWLKWEAFPAHPSYLKSTPSTSPSTHAHRVLFHFAALLFFFPGLRLWHMKVPRLGVGLELQLLAYPTAHGNAESLTH